MKYYSSIVCYKIISVAVVFFRIKAIAVLIYEKFSYSLLWHRGGGGGGGWHVTGDQHKPRYFTALKAVVYTTKWRIWYRNKTLIYIQRAVIVSLVWGVFIVYSWSRVYRLADQCYAGAARYRGVRSHAHTRTHGIFQHELPDKMSAGSRSVSTALITLILNVPCWSCSRQP